MLQLAGKVRLCVIGLLGVFAVSAGTNALAEGKLTKQQGEQVQKVIQEEVDKNTKYLLSKSLNKAKQIEEVYHDFSPFGAALLPNGEVKFVWLAKPGEVVADPVKAMLVIRSTLNAQAVAAKILGSAVVYKYIVPETKDPLVNVEVEYATGTAKLVSASYTKDKEGKVIWGRVKEVEADPLVFKVYENSAVPDTQE